MATATTGHQTTQTREGCVKIAAIDNGLAFPFKHPDEWRTCTTTYMYMQLLERTCTCHVHDMYMYTMCMYFSLLRVQLYISYYFIF